MRKDEAFKHIESLSRKDYEESVLKAFDEWCELNDTEALKKEIYSIMSMSFQKMWTDKLAKANTKDYAKLIGRFNRETFYSKEIYVHITPLMKLEAKNDPEIKRYKQKAATTA